MGDFLERGDIMVTRSIGDWNERGGFMRALHRALLVGGLAVGAGVPGHAAQYPVALAVDAQVKSGATAITSKLTIRVDRLMEESRWMRVSDALKFGGYANALNTLRALPPVGTIQLEKRLVDIRYAREQGQATKGRRLLLIADRPLFFLSGDPKKSRAGYELTVVDLQIDEQGGVSGTMNGAARVKPSPDGVVLDDFADVEVQLTGRVTQP